ncbi:pseudouridine-5' phosphatase [Lachnospiraceae bacterium KM106-2]|nr:pseudouridine-5' phosphatase [Lachnospiraceae bacterium KM106-2]
MIKGAIFDMDGLMFDTERLAKQGWLSAAKQLNYPITEEMIDHIRGTNVAYSKKLFLTTYGEKVDYDLARKVRTDYVNEWIEEHGVPIKKGLKELLSYLKEKEIPCAVATSTHRELATKYLKMAGVFDYFTEVVFGDEVSKGKPDPEIFLTAASKLGVSCKDCIILEDSPHGIKAGFAAGAKVIGIEDLTPLAKESLEMTTWVCESLDQVIEKIK